MGLVWKPRRRGLGGLVQTSPGPVGCALCGAWGWPAPLPVHAPSPGLGSCRRGKAGHCPALPPGSANPRQEHHLPLCRGCQDPGPVHAGQGADDLDEGEAGR